jgi:hypothetical protein
MTPAADPAALASYGSQLKLNARGASPPTSAYIGANDQLVVAIWNALANQVVQVFARLLLPDGSLSLNQWQFTPTSNRAKNQFVVPLTECFILSVLVNDTLASSGNRTFVSVRIVTGSTGLTNTQNLTQGYITPQKGLTFPPGVHENGTDGMGALVSVTGTTPGAGAEISEVVPASALWRLISFRYQLTTAATVATRQSDLLIDDGANTFAELATSDTQVASLVQIYNWVDGAGGLAVQNGIATNPGPRQMFLPAGFRIRTHTFNLQAGDQYTAPQYLVEEWLFN